MKVEDRVRVIKHAKGNYLGKTGIITSSGGVMWGGARKFGTEKPLMAGAKGRQMWWVRIEDKEETIICLEENIKLIPPKCFEYS
jgi:hypothetical protein